MKICFLSVAVWPHTIKWCEYFRDKGYEVILISLKPGFIPGVKIYSLFPEERKSANFSSRLLSLLKVKKIKGIIKKEKPDILHAHYATIYGFLGALSKFNPYILSVWGTDVYDFPKRSFLHKALLKYNLSKADYIFSTSKVMADETRKYISKDIMITPFGVDLNVFYPDNSQKPNNKIRIGSIRTLEDRYGLDYLIKAFSIVREKLKDYDLELYIGGKGKKEEELRNLVKELNMEKDVKFLGYLNQKEVSKFFNSFHIAVFPSIYDSFCVAAVEAQACEVPVIASKVGGFFESTQPRITSLLVEPRNIIEIANAMEELIIDEDKRLMMGKAGRKFVVENFNIEDNFKEVENLYLEIISEK